MDASAAPVGVRMTANKGRGLFASRPIAQGTPLVEMKGQTATVADLPDDVMAMQIGDDLWLYSPGDLLDDCGNHSCEPNAGFVAGDLVLYALRDIAADEEICWDYSTSIDCEDWSLDCRCGSPRCRGVVRPWRDLPPNDRERLRPLALAYLRNK